MSGACRCSTWSKWLPRDSVLLLVQKQASHCLPPFTLEMPQSNVMLWSEGGKKQVHNETLMRTHFRQSRGHNFGKAWGKSVFLNTPTAEELGAQFWISHICVVMHTPNVCSCSRYTCNLCIYLCKRTSHLCVKWKMWMWALSTVCNHEWKKNIMAPIAVTGSVELRKKRERKCRKTSTDFWIFSNWHWLNLIWFHT